MCIEVMLCSSIYMNKILNMGEIITENGNTLKHQQVKKMVMYHPKRCMVKNLAKWDESVDNETLVRA